VRVRLRLYPILVILVLTLAIPTIFLRGTFQQKTVGPTIWAESFNNLTAWSLSSNAPGVVQLNNSLVLSVAFPLKSVSQAVTASRTLNLSLDKNPAITLTLAVTSGASYGIRFYGLTSNGTSFAAWREGSFLQHRRGLGTQETISANLVSEFLLANPKLPLVGSRITKLSLYIEAAPLISGNFTAVVADLGPTIQSQGLFQVFVGLDIKGSTDLSYVPYFISGASVLAQGFTYVPKIATTYELALLQPSFVNSSPLFVGKPSSSSIVVSARTGEMTFFRLNSVSIRFLSSLSAPIQTLSPSSYQLLLFYYFIFLFVAPTGMIVLLVKVFRDEE